MVLKYLHEARTELTQSINKREQPEIRHDKWIENNVYQVSGGGHRNHLLPCMYMSCMRVRQQTYTTYLKDPNLYIFIIADT